MRLRGPITFKLPCYPTWFWVTLFCCNRNPVELMTSTHPWHYIVSSPWGNYSHVCICLVTNRPVPSNTIAMSRWGAEQRHDVNINPKLLEVWVRKGMWTTSLLFLYWSGVAGQRQKGLCSMQDPGFCHQHWQMLAATCFFLLSIFTFCCFAIWDRASLCSLG